MTVRGNPSQWFCYAIGWIIRALLGVLFVALACFLEDRYALFSGTAVRIKVTKLAEETNADGKTFLFCEFDKFIFRRMVTERLRVSNDSQPIHTNSAMTPVWSSQSVSGAFKHALQPQGFALQFEIPIKRRLSSRPILKQGDVIWLKRRDRVVIAKYEPSPSCDPTDKAVSEVELSYEIE